VWKALGFKSLRGSKVQEVQQFKRFKSSRGLGLRFKVVRFCFEGSVVRIPDAL
jgi:hypothetical protein